MDAIFTLPFSEYEVINELKKNLKGGCSYYVPTMISPGYTEPVGIWEIN